MFDILETLRENWLGIAVTTAVPTALFYLVMRKLKGIPRELTAMITAYVFIMSFCIGFLVSDFDKDSQVFREDTKALINSVVEEAAELGIEPKDEILSWQQNSDRYAVLKVADKMLKSEKYLSKNDIIRVRKVMDRCFDNQAPFKDLKYPVTFKEKNSLILVSQADYEGNDISCLAKF